MDPEKPDRAALDLEERNQDILHLQFTEGMCSNLTAQNLAYLFSDFGDFHLFKDTKDSAILNFYYMDQHIIGGKTIQSFITFISQPLKLEKYHIESVSPYSDAPRFKAHNHIE
jgi:hypothetical protein